jgi:hypothetical protein
VSEKNRAYVQILLHLLLSTGLLLPCNQGRAAVEQETEAQIQSLEDPIVTEDVDTLERNSRYARSQHSWLVAVNYSLFDLLVPSKKGATIGYQRDKNLVYELEYLQGTLSVPYLSDYVGVFEERRASLFLRTFMGTKSFSLFGGVFYNQTQLKMSDTVLSTIPGTAPYFDLLNVSTLGIGAGLGNRWSAAYGLNFGVDWFAWQQPLLIVHRSNQETDAIGNRNYRDVVNNAVKKMHYFPRLSLLKIQLGWSF